MKKHWWDACVAYQIYPRSFQDTNNDGVGDLKGITMRLDYLKYLGIKLIWISPIFQSPMVDGGYDISNYNLVDPMFGTNEDLNELLLEAKKKGIAIILDMVLNHTSDEHSWFKEALLDPLGPAGQRYIICKGVDGKAPNNWRSYFGGSVWESIEGTDLYYFHAFHMRQPDLNWENPVVRNDIFNMMNSWCKKGVAGFRIDAIGNIKKHIEYKQYKPDGIDGLASVQEYIVDQPGIELFFEEMKQMVLKPNDCFTVAEIPISNQRLKKYIGENGYFTCVFDFSFVDVDLEDNAGWLKQKDIDAKNLRDKIFEFQIETQKNGLPAPYFENHDQPRAASKYLKTIGINDTSKKMLATLHLFLKGIPFIYQGQEIGMENIKLADISMYDDIATIDHFNRALKNGINRAEALKLVQARSRDNTRTPMQWSNSIFAEFSNAKPWLPVNENFVNINVNNNIEDPDSVFNFYKKLIAIRCDSEYSNILVYGDFVAMEFQDDFVMPFKRVYGDREIIVLVNYSENQNRYELNNEYKVIVSNYLQEEYNGVLEPYQAIALIKTNN